MSIQCEPLQRECIARPFIITHWLQASMASVSAFYTNWTYQRRIKKSRRILESLPEHIRHDIGWPCVDDRLPAPARRGQMQ